MRNYHPLPEQRLSGAVFVARPAPPKSVTPDSPALDVMTDLRYTHSALIEPHTSVDAAHALVRKYAQTEPEILKRDFLNSLRAAFRIDEIRDQLLAAHLEYLHVRTVSDRHVLISGIFQTDRSQGRADPTPAR